MSASYAIDIDPARGLLQITLSGFFTVADIDAFVPARNEAHGRLASRHNGHVTLVDVRDMNIQSQDAVARFQEMLSDPRTAGRRVAFVVAQSLSRMQAQRAARGRTSACFATAAEAERWLLADESAGA